MIGRRRAGAGFAAGILGVASRRPPAPAEPPPREGGLARVLRTKTLRVAVRSDDEPYVGKNAGGQWRGIVVALAADLAGELGVAPALVDAGTGDRAADLAAGRIDLCFDLAPTARRALSVDFSHDLFHDTVVVVTRAGLAPKHWAELDVPETRLAVANGTAVDAIVRRLVGNATITGFKTHAEAVAAVHSGRSDGAVTPLLSALVALHRDPSLGWLIVPLPQARMPICAALAYDTDRRLRDVVDAWAEEARADDRVQGFIRAALAELGVGADAVPPRITF